MQHTKHVFRVLIALVVLVVTYILVRGQFVPKSFGKHGAYRFDNVAEQRDKPLRHGAVDACQGCHKPVWDKRAKGKHATVSCEGATRARHSRGRRQAHRGHGQGPSYQLCVRCHRKLASRPASVIKQVVPEEHVSSQGEKLQGTVCVGCHDVHSPQMATTTRQGREGQGHEGQGREGQGHEGKDAKPEKGAGAEGGSR